jgi:hypothetical protein
MDLNQLYFDHQILRMRADGSSLPGPRARHLRHAATIAARIGWVQRAAGAGAWPAWHRLAGGIA